jgi:hypothetical protein
VSAAAASAPIASPADSEPRSGKKDDIDTLMDKMPSELRKRLGF